MARFSSSTPGSEICSGVDGIFTTRIDFSLLLVLPALEAHDLAYERAFIVVVYDGIIWLKVFSES